MCRCLFHLFQFRYTFCLAAAIKHTLTDIYQDPTAMPSINPTYTPSAHATSNPSALPTNNPVALKSLPSSASASVSVDAESAYSSERTVIRLNQAAWTDDFSDSEWKPDSKIQSDLDGNKYYHGIFNEQHSTTLSREFVIESYGEIVIGFTFIWGCGVESIEAGAIADYWTLTHNNKTSEKYYWNPSMETMEDPAITSYCTEIKAPNPMAWSQPMEFEANIQPNSAYSIEFYSYLTTTKPFNEYTAITDIQVSLREICNFSVFDLEATVCIRT